MGMLDKRDCKLYSVMKKFIIPILLLFISSCSTDETLEPDNQVILEEILASIQNNSSNTENILLLVDLEVLSGIKTKLIRFIKDLNTSKQNIYIELIDGQSHFEIKNEVKSYVNDSNIDGCILIGDIPIPKAQIETQFNTSFKGVSTQYYMDLDGEFEFENPNIISNHTGDRNIEIWVSVIPSYGQNPIQNINLYLDKNHKYRTGGMTIEKGFLEALIGARIEDVETYEEQYNFLAANSYIKLSERGNLFYGIDNKLDNNLLYPDAKYTYEHELLKNKYDVARIGAHGSHTRFGSFDEWGSIIVDIDYARSTPVKPILLLESSCNSAAIDQFENLASEFLYNPNNNVLAYSGATTPQGGKGKTVHGDHRNFTAAMLTGGSRIGESVFAAMYYDYTSGIYNDYREYFSAQQILLGDGSLRLQEFN